MTAYVLLSGLLLCGILYACISPAPARQTVRIRAQKPDRRH